MHIGKKIKLLRIYNNLTQQDLADKVNKTRALVSHVEQTGKVNHYTLIEILKIFKISLEEFELFDPNGPLNKESNKQEYAKNEEITLLKEKLEYYQKEIDLLKDLVKSQKTIIEMYDKKKK